MSTPAEPGAATLRALVARATLAPSTRNAQPWRWTVHPDHVDLELDDAVAHRLEANDPQGRELVMSCGAALLTLRVAAAEALFDAHVDVLPDPHRPHLIACVTVEPGAIDAAFAELDAVVPLRHTAWTAFDERPLPAELPERLAAEADVEGALLRQVGAGERPALTDLLRHADHERYDDPRRRAEVAEWISSRWSDRGRVLPTVAVVRREPPSAISTSATASPNMTPTSWARRRTWACWRRPATPRPTGSPPARRCSACCWSRPRTASPGASSTRPARSTTTVGGCVTSCRAASTPQLVLRLGYPLTRPPATPRRPVGEVVTVQDGPIGPDGDERAGVPGAARDAGADFTEDTLG